MTEEEELEEQIEEVRRNMRKVITNIKEPNHCEFMEFLLNNYDYKHDCWKLDRDMSLKLKEEEDRTVYNQSEGFQEF